MSKSKHLPIYRVGYQLLSLVTDLVRNFSRDFRPTLGHRLQGESVALVLQVYRANAAEEKGSHIAHLLETLQVVEMLLQLCSDMRLISIKQYASTIVLTDDIGRQAGGWKKYESGRKRQ